MASPIIYCDMDGVLADFKTAAVKVNGMSINQWMRIPSSQQKWERIKNTGTFWHNLPWMPGGQALQAKELQLLMMELLIKEEVV